MRGAGNSSSTLRFVDASLPNAHTPDERTPDAHTHIHQTPLQTHSSRRTAPDALTRERPLPPHGLAHRSLQYNHLDADARDALAATKRGRAAPLELKL